MFLNQYNHVTFARFFVIGVGISVLLLLYSVMYMTKWIFKNLSTGGGPILLLYNVIYMASYISWFLCIYRLSLHARGL